MANAYYKDQLIYSSCSNLLTVDKTVSLAVILAESNHLSTGQAAVKRTVSRDFRLRFFFHHTTSPAPNRNAKKTISNFFRIFVELFVFLIRIRFLDDEYTGESIRIPEVKQFLQR